MAARSKSHKGYYYIENRHPEEDPNIDLNFENDILYNDLLGDEVDLSDVPIQTAEVTPSKAVSKHNIKKSTSVSDYNYNICFYFIIIVIALVLVWYLFRTEQKPEPNIVDTFVVKPDLVMLSPDIGMGSRFVSI